MTVLTVGISHHSAPIALLEDMALGPIAAADLSARLTLSDTIDEVLVLATCNRVEMVMEVQAFHGALRDAGEALAATTGTTLDELTDHLYVHYDERAVSHLFLLACGLDSMAVGESQILGQLRESLAIGQRAGQVGPVLNKLVQQALRVGKRAHTETQIDAVAGSLVELGLAHARQVVPDLTQANVVVIGAGAMSGLAAATVSRTGAGALHVVNRTIERGQRLALAHDGIAHQWDDLPWALAQADVVITCTGSLGYVLGADLVAQARAEREQPLAILDLAMPRDVEPAVSEAPGVQVWGLAQLQVAQAAKHSASSTDAVAQVRDLVTGEVAVYLTHRRASRVGPTVAALRARADQVVASELGRLGSRMPHLSADEFDEVRLGIQRVVDKLLHTPTVRVKELEATDDVGDYAHALRDLFDLDPHDVAAVSTPPTVGPGDEL